MNDSMGICNAGNRNTGMVGNSLSSGDTPYRGDVPNEGGFCNDSDGRNGHVVDNCVEEKNRPRFPKKSQFDLGHDDRHPQWLSRKMTRENLVLQPQQ